MSKGSSQEELDHENRLQTLPDIGDSEEYVKDEMFTKNFGYVTFCYYRSSGVHEDSENEFPSVPPRGVTKYQISQASQLPQSLTDSMPALTLALTSTPWKPVINGKLTASRSSSGSTSGTGSKSSASGSHRPGSASPKPKDRR